MQNFDTLTAWEGTGDDLADIASRILRERGFAEDPVSPNVRLIRDYASRGILTKPERRGKEAIYAYRHLLEFVAARVLVADGWPLAKIAEHFVHISDDELRTLIPGQERGNRALELARSFLRGGSPPRDAARPQAKFSKSTVGDKATQKTTSGTLFRERAARVSSIQADLRNAMDRLGLPPDAPPMQQVTLIAIAPWCQLLIETERLKTLTASDAEEIGRAITASLLNPSIRKEIS
ncbi:MAG: hypothetical protein ACOYLQ_20645 [Hyphomicrobiaceae bacterium]|jgi:hypothetical protein